MSRSLVRIVWLIAFQGFPQAQQKWHFGQSSWRLSQPHQHKRFTIKQAQWKTRGKFLVFNQNQDQLLFRVLRNRWHPLPLSDLRGYNLRPQTQQGCFMNNFSIELNMNNNKMFVWHLPWCWLYFPRSSPVHFPASETKVVFPLWCRSWWKMIPAIALVSPPSLL